jgi:hypothetical protein
MDNFNVWLNGLSLNLQEQIRTHIKCASEIKKFEKLLHEVGVKFQQKKMRAVRNLRFHPTPTKSKLYFQFMTFVKSRLESIRKNMRKSLEDLVDDMDPMGESHRVYADDCEHEEALEIFELSSNKELTVGDCNRLNKLFVLFRKLVVTLSEHSSNKRQLNGIIKVFDRRAWFATQ